MGPIQAISRLLLLLAFLPNVAETRAGEPRAAIPPDLILHRFAVAKDGELLIPVNIDGKDRLFMVDTGATTTVIDTRLLPGQPLEFIEIETSGGVAKIGLHALPKASVAGVPLRLDFVLGQDMERLREVSGQPIEGVIGMDCLGRYVVHIDSDRGELMLLKSVPEGAGEVLPMTSEPGELPQIDAWVTGEKRVRFLIDTGCVGFDTGSLNVADATSLVRTGEIRTVGTVLSEVASGTRSSSLYQGKDLLLGTYRIDRPVYGDTPGRAVIGRGFWSQFAVTFDFPGRKVYLIKGKKYDRPDRWNRSGLHLIRRGGSVVVDIVDRQSPAESAGVRSGDVLLAFDGMRSQNASLDDFRSALCGEGRRVCVVERRGQQHRLMVCLTR